MTLTQDPVRLNDYPGVCRFCDQPVAIEQGYIEKIDGWWRVACMDVAACQAMVEVKKVASPDQTRRLSRQERLEEIAALKDTLRQQSEKHPSL